MDAQSAIQDILIPAIQAGLWVILSGIAWGAWGLVKNALSKRTVQVLDEIVWPILTITLKDPAVQAKFRAMFAPDSPGGRWPTGEELAGIAKACEIAARPQLQRLRGFAIARAEEEVLASVRRFFARMIGSGRASTISLPAGLENAVADESSSN